MKITLDITNKFMTVVNHEHYFDMAPMFPVLFLDFLNDLSDRYCLRLMNFGLNIDKEMEAELARHSPHFDDIVSSDFTHKSLLIFNEATFEFSGIKGGDARFYGINEANKGEALYHTWPYTITKGDYQFLCGGHSPFSPHYILLHLIGKSDSKATITFSSDDYILIDPFSIEMEEHEASKQTPLSIQRSDKGAEFLSACTHTAGRMFDFGFYTKHFKLVYGDRFHTSIAVKSENE